MCLSRVAWNRLTPPSASMRADQGRCDYGLRLPAAFRQSFTSAKTLFPSFQIHQWIRRLITVVCIEHQMWLNRGERLQCP